MTQQRVRRRSQSTPSSKSNSQSAKTRRNSKTTHRERRNSAWSELRNQDSSRSTATFLTNLIEQDAPLKTHSTLVLMYGPFQAEMAAENGQGVASWLRDCVHKHGLPSLVRFDYRHRAQVFRRDQFQPWLEPFLSKNAS
jgi:hypothetical protein